MNTAKARPSFYDPKHLTDTIQAASHKTCRCVFVKFTGCASLLFPVTLIAHASGGALVGFAIKHQ